MKKNAINSMCSQYDKIVNWFDTTRYKGLMEKEYLDLALKHLPKNGTVLDLGCGTGEPLAQFFIDKGFTVTGVDGSDQMISLCKTRFPTMRWLHSDMRQIQLHEKFDLLLAWDSLFHLNHNDQRAMFKVFQNHIKNNGVLIFTCDDKYGEVYGTMNGYEFYHASLDSQEYGDLLHHYGFKVLLHKVKDPD